MRFRLTIDTWSALMNLRKTALATVLAVGASMPLTSLADSDFTVGGVGSQALADLNFEVVIPAFVYLRVGSVGATVDTVQFDLTGIAPGTGPGTVPDVNVTVQLTSNAPGGVNLTASAFVAATGPLAASVPEISVSDTGTISHPAFGGAAVNFGGTINVTDTWTFSYANNNVYPVGTYSDTITYTAENL
jgi:hypothetical protein